MKDYIIVFKDSEKKPRPISSGQALSVADALKNKDISYIELKGENGFLEDMIDKRNIKEVTKNNLEDMSQATWLCDSCGASNPMHVWPGNKCQCKGDRTKWLQNKVEELRGRENV